jgi:spore coat protein H
MLKKVLRYTFFLLYSHIGLSQNDTIQINPPYFSIDQGKKLILINADIQVLNQNYPGHKTAIRLEDSLYQFSDTVFTLQTGIRYGATLNDILYGIYFSELPVIRLVVNDTIRDSPKVLGHFEMVHPALETLSHLVGLEYRGASSQAYPKKSMELEFWADSLGDDSEDISLLGMLPKNNSWNLQALYVEACRTNSMVSNAIWEKIHHAHYLSSEPEAKSGIRMKYVEVFLNSSYYGLYAIGQKVNRDLLKLKKNEPETVRGELIKCDDWTPGTLFTGTMSFDNSLRRIKRI